MKKLLEDADTESEEEFGEEDTLHSRQLLSLQRRVSSVVHSQKQITSPSLRKSSSTKTQSQFVSSGFEPLSLSCTCSSKTLSPSSNPTCHFSLPLLLLNFEILRDVVSVEVWNSSLLTPQDRASLLAFLPSAPSSSASSSSSSALLSSAEPLPLASSSWHAETLRCVFSPTNLRFGSPLQRFHSALRAGRFHPLLQPRFELISQRSLQLHALTLASYQDKLASFAAKVQSVARSALEKAVQGSMDTTAHPPGGKPNKPQISSRPSVSSSAARSQPLTALPSPALSLFGGGLPLQQLLSGLGVLGTSSANPQQQQLQQQQAQSLLTFSTLFAALQPSSSRPPASLAQSVTSPALLFVPPVPDFSAFPTAVPSSNTSFSSPPASSSSASPIPLLLPPTMAVLANASSSSASRGSKPAKAASSSSSGSSKKSSSSTKKKKSKRKDWGKGDKYQRDDFVLGDDDPSPSSNEEEDATEHDSETSL